MTTVDTVEKLKPITLAQVQKDHPPVPAKQDVGAAGKFDAQADAFVESLLNVDPRDEALKRQAIMSVEGLGAEVVKILARHNSGMLKAPAHLIAEAEDGGPVAMNILQLQEKVAEVNPNGFDFSQGGLRKLLAMLPWIGTPMSRWYAKYQTVEAVISDIVKNMESGKRELANDNTTLSHDQSVMRQLTYQLEDYIEVGLLAERKLTSAVEALAEDDPKKAFLKDKVLFPMNQRLMDLQQQLVVNQQGYLSIEVIVENNKQLIRGVDRALNVTVTALGVAATLAIALKRQKKVLDATNALNDTTGDMLLQTSEQLKTQGVEIQKQASTANIDVEKIKAAFSNVEDAIKDLSTFRQEALAPMRDSIDEMSALSERMEAAIKDVETGHEIEEKFTLALDHAEATA